MFNKKSKNEDSGGMGALGALFSTLLMAPLISKVESFVADALSQAKDSTEKYISRILKMFILVGVAFAGSLFILVGLARIINETLGKQGVGELIIGGTILLIALVWYGIPSKR